LLRITDNHNIFLERLKYFEAFKKSKLPVLDLSERVLSKEKIKNKIK
jgi:hypothetical protein